jgi:trimeric autotransporter adhesin
VALCYPPPLLGALTEGSYQGTWDFRDASSAASPTNGLTLYVGADGSFSCTDKSTGATDPCTVNFTDLASGAFNYTNGASTASRTLDFLAGSGRGRYVDPTSTPPAGNWVVGRR